VRVKSCQATWMMPAEALRRFAGADRLYYALGTYGNHLGDDPRFSIAPYALERVPFIALGTAFSGRSLGWRHRRPARPRRRRGPGCATGGGAATMFERQRRAEHRSEPVMGPMTLRRRLRCRTLARRIRTTRGGARGLERWRRGDPRGHGAALTDDGEDGETYGGRVWSRAAEETS
jgi:hypothetical protein